MKPPRTFGVRPHVRYRPELTSCPWCGAGLLYSHAVWAQWVQSLDRIEHVTNLGDRCPAPECAGHRTVFRSARAAARQVKGSSYGLAVIAHIGALRFGRHHLRTEIWQPLETETAVAISERHVQHLLETYLARRRASPQDWATLLRPTVADHGGLLVSLDGRQPEQGNEQVWVVREVVSGTVVGAANLQQATAPMLVPLLEPIRAAGRLSQWWLRPLRPHLLTEQQLAARCNVVPRTIQRMVRDGDLHQLLGGVLLVSP